MAYKTDHIIVRYSVLQENQQLFATKYLPYPPTEAELVAEIEWGKLGIRAEFGRSWMRVVFFDFDGEGLAQWGSRTIKIF